MKQQLHLSHRRAGLTMIELMTALSLFVLIFGALMLALNSATRLWQSGTQQHEEPLVQHALDLMVDDLHQALGDYPTAFTNLSHSNFAFLLQNIETNLNVDTPLTLLAFARYAAPRTRDPDLNSGTRIGLDAVFYTYYHNALFRHIVPLHVDYTHPEELSAIIGGNRDALENPGTHEELLAERYDGSFTTSTLLARRVVPTLIAHFPEAVDNCETNLLPHALDIALHHFSEVDWQKFLPLALDDSPQAVHQKQQLGVLLTRRIALPQSVGGRLP